MVISLTKLSDKQWSRVGKVVMWSAISAALAVATAYVTSNPAWLATYPGWNIAGVLLQQILTQEEDKALSEVPSSLQSNVKAGDDKLAEIVKEQPQKAAPVVQVVNPPTTLPASSQSRS